MELSFRTVSSVFVESETERWQAGGGNVKQTWNIRETDNYVEVWQE